MNKYTKCALVVIFTLTTVAASSFGLGYYVLRQTANDPQLALANDTVYALEKGRSTNNLLPDLIIELENGQSLYGAIYDDNLKPISYSATLDGKPPAPPKGVFEKAKQNGVNSIIWGPRDGIRSSIVVKRYDGIRKGYVLFGRSMQATDSRLMWLAKAIAVGWVIGVATTVISLLLVRRMIGTKKPTTKAKPTPQAKD